MSSCQNVVKYLDIWNWKKDTLAWNGAGLLSCCLQGRRLYTWSFTSFSTTLSKNIMLSWWEFLLLILLFFIALRVFQYLLIEAQCGGLPHPMPTTVQESPMVEIRTVSKSVPKFYANALPPSYEDACRLPPMYFNTMSATTSTIATDQQHRQLWYSINSYLAWQASVNNDSPMYSRIIVYWVVDFTVMTSVL